MKQCIQMKTIRRNGATLRRCARFSGSSEGGHREGLHKMSAGSMFAALNRSVPVGHAALGVLAGTGSALGAKWLANRFGLAAHLPDIAVKLLPLAASVGVGTGLYFLQKKKNPQRATAHLVGAAVGGAAVTVWDYARAKFPALADMTVLDLNDYGLVIDDSGNVRALNDLNAVVDIPNEGMQQAAAIAMNGADDGDYYYQNYQQ
jgi:hypothetical protein